MIYYNKCSFSAIEKLLSKVKNLYVLGLSNTPCFTSFEEFAIWLKIYKNLLNEHKSGCPYLKASHFSVTVSTIWALKFVYFVYKCHETPGPLIYSSPLCRYKCVWRFLKLNTLGNFIYLVIFVVAFVIRFTIVQTLSYMNDLL